MSTEPKLNKYIVVSDKSQANEYVELGYKLHTFTTAKVENDMVQEYWVMSLSEDSKYDDVGKFKRMPITDEWTAVPEGVEIIHHTSKEMIVTKKRTPTKLSLIREYLIQIFNIAEDNDVKDPTIMDQIYRLSDRALNEIDGGEKTESL